MGCDTNFIQVHLAWGHRGGFSRAEMGKGGSHVRGQFVCEKEVPIQAKRRMRKGENRFSLKLTASEGRAVCLPPSCAFAGVFRIV